MFRCGALLLILSAGCNSVVGGGAAEADVTIFGDKEVVVAPAPSVGPPRATPALQVAHSFEGTVTVRLRAFLVAGAFPISISGADQEVEVSLIEGVSTPLNTFLISPGVYQGLRILFTEIRADVTSGLGSSESSGGGVVTVDLGNEGFLVLEEDLQILLRDDIRLKVNLELRAPEWLAAVAGESEPRVVSAEEFLAAAHIGIRPE
ncbi:MAG: hypothetical protein WEG36_00670 [Gemmatimonadota bacterium]